MQPTPDLEALKSSLDNWANVVGSNAEHATIKALIRSYLDSSKGVDAFVNWLLIGTGGTASLVIANLDQLVRHIGAFNYKWALALIAVSMMWGLAVRLSGMRIALMRSVEDQIERQLAEVHKTMEADQRQIDEIADKFGMEANARVEQASVMASFIELHPRPVRWIVRRLVEGSVRDPRFPLKKAVVAYILQSSFLGLQVISFLAFIFVVVAGV